MKKRKVKIPKIQTKSYIKKIGAQLKVKGCALYTTYRKQIRKSLRLQILWMVFVGFVIASLGGVMIAGIARESGLGHYTYQDYEVANQQLQSRLTQAVRQINELEFVHSKLKLDLDELYEVIRAKEQGEGSIDALRVQIDNSNTFEYEGNYSSYNQAIESVKPTLYEVSDQAMTKLYNELLALKKEGKWEAVAVKEVIEAFFEEIHMTEANLKEAAIESVLDDLNSDMSYASDTQTLLIDAKGNIIYGDSFIKSIDILEAIRKASTSSELRGEQQRTSLYPLIIEGEIYYLLNNTTLAGVSRYDYTQEPVILGFLVGVIIFIAIILRGTKQKMKYIEYLAFCLGEISKGDLDFIVEKRGEDELFQVAEAMTQMEVKLKEQMQERAQAEKTKSELITNVAHDLRTPLTSVIGYIGLVKDEKYQDKEESAKYLDIAYNKSERLKILIEDLFEYTKLSNRAVQLKKEDMSIATLMNQLIEELMPLAEDKNMRISFHVAAKETGVKVDVLKMTRVFENLIENAIKYSEEGETIQVVIQETSQYVYVTVRNRCKEMPEKDMAKLFDRFYRSDSSRNSSTGGSGLGLAIAKNIVEIHEGKIWAQLDQDKISFNVKLKKA